MVMLAGPREPIKAVDAPLAYAVWTTPIDSDDWFASLSLRQT